MSNCNFRPWFRSLANLFSDGNELRQLAGLGLAAVSLDYDQSNEAVWLIAIVVVN